MEHFDAAMASVSAPLIAVMGIKIALMAVMRLDVVSCSSNTGSTSMLGKLLTQN